MKSDSLEITDNIDLVPKDWDNDSMPSNLTYNYLNSYFTNNSKLIHLFIHNKSSRFYFNLFKLNFSKATNYSKHWSRFFLRYFEIKMLLLSNSFDSTKNYFQLNNDLDLKSILKIIKYKFDVIVLPENLYKSLNTKISLTKVEIEGNMILKINEHWNSIEDYLFALKKKYRYKFKKILKSTDNLEIRHISKEFIDKNYNLIQSLLDQVVSTSSFNGPKFNVKTFSSLLLNEHIIVRGYFLEERLVGFSTYSIKESELHTNYVGFDKNLNFNLPIYARMILDHISTAIEKKSTKLILGRTANEFKSNFGAVPEKNFIYIKFTNVFLNLLFNPLIKNIKIKKWKQRRPFKESSVKKSF